jgi:hypothetical protein
LQLPLPFKRAVRGARRFDNCLELGRLTF